MSFIFFVISSILILEFILFVSGQSLLWLKRTEKPGRDPDIRIVCVGDSHTFGVGTSALYAYPKQLEKLLNDNNPGQRFSVVNLGVPGSSTRMQAQALRAFFEGNSAKVVILLTGRNIEDEVSRWGDQSLSHRIMDRFTRLRSVRFLKVIVDGLLKKKEQPRFFGNPEDRKKYEAYLSFYLKQIEKLCRKQGAALVLLSYYNSQDDIIKAFAIRRKIPYFDFTSDFIAIFRRTNEKQYISPDHSHMNHRGYKFFAEQLYNHLFLNRDYLHFKIGPLLRTIQESEFYADGKEKEQMIKIQETRVAQSKGTWAYPFEMVILGHIYSEIADDASALKSYKEGLVASDYSDNNMIFSPVVDWYLKKGQKEEVLKICEESLLHNPGNTAAQFYRDELLLDPQLFSEVGQKTD
ncbi:MAG: SGNH/GDSL hydrolase family protein [Candidatus Omnitrophota bacterium]